MLRVIGIFQASHAYFQSQKAFLLVRNWEKNCYHPLASKRLLSHKGTTDNWEREAENRVKWVQQHWKSYATEENRSVCAESCTSSPFLPVLDPLLRWHHKFQQLPLPSLYCQCPHHCLLPYTLNRHIGHIKLLLLSGLY